MNDDLISRRAAIEALEEPCKVPDTWTDEYAVGERAQWEKDVKALNNLPSVEPFRQKEKLKLCVESEDLFPDLPQIIKDKNTEIVKAYQEGYEQGKKDAERRGRWVAVENDIDYYPFMCSECYETVIKKTNYCPRCKAKMDEVSKDESC